MDARELIARRVARELRDNTLVNLGIGLPTMVAGFVPPRMRVYFQSENGIIGFGARPPEGMEDVHLTDAGGAFVSALPGAVAFDSATSFALIRGGHLDMTVLGGLQVDRRGRLGWWLYIRKRGGGYRFADRFFQRMMSPKPTHVPMSHPASPPTSPPA